ncbi:MAG TPA: tannase/feruloyl esterase family alpha/beta hydrolase [Candidatus Angelobacter sp.]
MQFSAAELFGRVACVAILACPLALNAASTESQSCEALSALKLKDTTIISASPVAAGEFEIPANVTERSNSSVFKSLPAFCRVTAEIKPTQDSDIKLEVWLPATGWNGRYVSHGNGGFAGSIIYASLANGVKEGYAVAATDTGHSGNLTDGSWALGHPEKIKDFGYRGIHEMTVKAKAILHAYYGKAQQYSYFSSCSNGGRQGLMEAQRFPEDYDGIIAGAPANFFTHLLVANVWNMQALQNSSASYIPPSRISAINDAVLAACDAQDGVNDGIVNDPSACHFDPAILLCKSADSNCLTAPQVAALKKIYAGPKSSKGEQVYPGLVPGGEKGFGGWAAWITGSAPGKSLNAAFATNFFSNMVFDKSAWDFKTFNFDADVKITDDKQAANLNATNADLKNFKSRGGKLIIYHGWNDAAISPLNTIDYYNSVEKNLGPRDVNAFMRLYMAPGMQHCGGGPGPDSFGAYESSAGSTDPEHSMFSALEQWMEKGMAPDRIIATKLNDPTDPAKGIRMTRPLCPYPQVAKYKGPGDSNDQANFVCAVPKR